MVRKMLDDNYFEILNYIKTLKVIDTHEHLPCKEEDRINDTDVIKEFLSHYLDRDFVSSGLPVETRRKIINGKMPVKEKWKILEPYWKNIKYTGYGRSVSIIAKELYGIDNISSGTIEELNSKFLETLVPGHFKKIIKDLCRIEACLLCVETIDIDYDTAQERSAVCDRELFSPVYMITELVYPYLWTHFERIEEESGIRITSFSMYCEAVEAVIEKAYAYGAVALKNYLAYFRTLEYRRVSRCAAEEQFNEIFKTKHIPDWHVRYTCSGRDFQDFMFHFILDIANKKNLVLQIHSGIQEGNGNIISNSNPALLSNLFLEYPDVAFDVFHMGYPYQNELTVLAKNFPNVFIDMCWTHIVSPNASVNALLEWIDTVPLNKISAFGGDYMFIDGVYGHLRLAQMDVSKALAVKVNEGLFDIDEAKNISKMLFYDNPKNIFRL
jgi:uncharacterized protein